MGGVAVQIKCPGCLARNKPRESHGLFRHSDGSRCQSYDEEWRHVTEPLGWYTFAWLPVKCRNQKTRWLASVEHHGDGSYTLGNRAY